MEKKTMGSFIATLRKANGMTQKNLAEMLNVSDKAISRWERDENAPDLSLIPVIAEIFNVTCDELLRGERIMKAENEKGEDLENVNSISNPKSEKLARMILQKMDMKSKTFSIISVGLGLIGLLLAFLCNVAYTSALLGFVLGMICLVIATIIHVAASMVVFGKLKNTEVIIDELDRYQVVVFKRFLYVMMILIAIFLAILPLSFVGAYTGILVEDWLPKALLYDGIFVIVFGILSSLLILFMLKRDKDANEKKYKLVAKYYRRSFLFCIIVGAIFFVTTVFLKPYEKTFDSFESFKDYMKTDEELIYEGLLDYVIVEENSEDEAEQDFIEAPNGTRYDFVCKRKYCGYSAEFNEDGTIKKITVNPGIPDPSILFMKKRISFICTLLVIICMIATECSYNSKIKKIQ